MGNYGKWDDKNNNFTNPYSFISLGEKCEREDYEKIYNRKDLLTGYLECSIVPKTDFFIPNTTNSMALHNPDGNINKKSYDFYSYQDLSKETNTLNNPPIPVIPGSEIRGVIRSAFESVTDSCMSTIDSERIIYKRTTVPGDEALLIKNRKTDKWSIIKAKKIKLKENKTFNTKGRKIYLSDLNEGQKAYYKVEQKKVILSNTKLSDVFEEGYIHKGEYFIGKQLISIFYKDNDDNNKRIEIDEDAVERLEKVLKLYKDPTINITNNHGMYKHYSLDENAEVYCIYYAEHNGVYYLSPAQISKEVFRNNLKSILERQGGYQPCETKDNICNACSLFGMVSYIDALSSRLRFTDARLENEKSINIKELFDQPIVLNELSSPKISATEFYLVRPPHQNSGKQYLDYSKDADIWNYDYAGKWKAGKGLPNMEETENYQPIIRGRKFYWHSTEIRKSADHNKRNVMVRPLKGNTRVMFTFKIYFDGVTEEELRQLIWTLNIGSNENNHFHKIGMGKPLGLGSIKIKVDQVKVREIKIENETIQYRLNDLSLDELQIEQAINDNKKEVKEFLRITDFDNKPSTVSYPMGYDYTNSDSKNNSGTHQWFIGNKAFGKGKSTAPIVYRTLPDLLNSNNTLKVLTKGKK